MSRTVFSTALLAVVAATPALAVPTAQPAEARFEIRGYVPVVCTAHLNAAVAPLGTGVQQLGELREFCNNARGYDVYVDVSPELAHAKLLVDGKPVPLGPKGVAVVSRSNRAHMGSHSIALDLGKNAQPGTLSFRIEPR